MRRIARLLREERAATTIEYAVMLSLILMVVMGAVGTVGSKTNGMWTSIVSQLKAIVFGG